MRFVVNEKWTNRRKRPGRICCQLCWRIFPNGFVPFRLVSRRNSQYIRGLGDHFHRQECEEEEGSCAHKHWLKFVAQHYTPKHSYVYDFDRWNFSERFKAFREKFASAEEAQGDQTKAFMEEPLSKVFTFDLLATDFCEDLVEEVQHFEQWCVEHNLHVKRPNTMNRYGAILDDFGFERPLDRWVGRIEKARVAGYLRR